jgi:hypothetical protein
MKEIHQEGDLTRNNLAKGVEDSPKESEETVVKTECYLDFSSMKLSLPQDFESLDLNTLVEPDDVVSINLSRNNFTDWFAIIDLVKQYPFLKNLDVSHNKDLQYVSDLTFSDVQKNKKIFHSVTSISANGLGYSWGPVMSCIHEMWSDKLFKLSLRSNDIDYMSKPNGSLLYLRNLDLSRNPINDWREVAKLGSLPNLEVLILKNCQISSISMMPEENLDVLSYEFPALQVLNLFENKLSSWKDVLELTRLNCLKEINLSHNPIVAPGPSFMDSTLICTALFGRFVKKLNGVEVNAKLVPTSEGYLSKKINRGDFPYEEYPVVERIVEFGKVIQNNV